MDPELERLLASAKAAGASPEQTQAFLRAHGYGPPGAIVASDATKVPGKNKAPWVSPAEAGMLAADQMSFGLGKRASAALDALLGNGTYGQNVQEYQGELDAARKKYGAAGSMLAGNLPLMAPAAAGMSAIKAGALFGGLSGAGNSGAFTGKPGATASESLGELAIGAGAGAAGGAILGRILGGAGTNLPATADRVAAARASKTPITIAQATDNPTLKILQGILGYVPTGRLQMLPFAERQAAALGSRAQELATQVAGPGAAIPSVEEAGAIAQRAAHEMGRRLEAQRAPLAQRVGAAVDAAHPDGVPLPGVADLIERWQQKLPKMTSEHAAEIQPALDRAVRLVQDAKTGAIDAAELLNRRTAIGQDAHFSPNPGLAKPDRTTGPTKDLWVALRGDLEEAVQAADAGTGGRAAQDALAQHDELVQSFRSGVGRNRADFWHRVATAADPRLALKQVMAQPGKGLQATQAEMLPEEYRAIAARHFLDLGRAPHASQDVAGDIFSPAKFLTEWSKLSPEAQRTLYPGLDPAARKNFLAVIDEVKKNALPNPSGTGGAVLGGGTLNKALEGLGQGYVANQATGSATGTIAGLVGPYLLAHGMTSQPAVTAIGATARGLSKVAPPSLWNFLSRAGANMAPAYTSGLLGQR